jgi:hypothetical protein
LKNLYTAFHISYTNLYFTPCRRISFLPILANTFDVLLIVILTCIMQYYSCGLDLHSPKKGMMSLFFFCKPDLYVFFEKYLFQFFTHFLFFLGCLTFC